MPFFQDAAGGVAKRRRRERQPPGACACSLAWEGESEGGGYGGQAFFARALAGWRCSCRTLEVAALEPPPGATPHRRNPEPPAGPEPRTARERKNYLSLRSRRAGPTVGSRLSATEVAGLVYRELQRPCASCLRRAPEGRQLLSAARVCWPSALLPPGTLPCTRVLQASRATLTLLAKGLYALQPASAGRGRCERWQTAQVDGGRH